MVRRQLHGRPGHVPHERYFRDVYLLCRPEQHIQDYFTTTGILPDRADIRVRLRYRDLAVATRITIYDAAGTLIGTAAPAANPDDEAFPYCAVIPVPAPILWNAEQPYLYTLVLETAAKPSRIVLHPGSSCADNQIFVNGHSIKIHGVNRHESDPVTGYTIGLEQTKTDLAMIKRHNFNAIRTSHYPDVPYFYQLCDEYGFFVIDEADNESHGASELYCDGNVDWSNHVEHWNEPISDNRNYRGHRGPHTPLCGAR